ncbi:MAG: hypothetical protein ISS48_01725 [Candidatus Aenigmarchaeota archaeon]|nr:hypothetical protein [Candidatus Aenigmarchaeota archaeon]
MVFRTIEIREISFEVEKKKQKEVVKKVKDLYPSLEVKVRGKKVSVSGDLHNYKRRDMIVYILSGGKHGKNIHAS